MAVIDRHTKVFGELPFKAHQIFEDVITYTALQFYNARTAGCRTHRRGTRQRDGRHRLVRTLTLPDDALPKTGEWLLKGA